MGIPSVKPKPWYTKEKWPAWVACGIGVVAAGSLLVAEINSSNPNNLKIVACVASLASVLIIGLLAIARSHYKDAQEERKDCPNDLRGCLHVIHQVVAARKRVSSPQDGWLRITIYSIQGEKRDTLEQAVNYVGGDDDCHSPGAGRQFSVSFGLIGVVARTGSPVSFDRPENMSFEDWASYLVKRTGMQREEAEATRKDRHAFLGVPIKNGDSVRAVVFLDAKEPRFFDKKTTALIVEGCSGLARWIDERYHRN